MNKLLVIALGMLAVAGGCRHWTPSSLPPRQPAPPMRISAVVQPANILSVGFTPVTTTNVWAVIYGKSMFFTNAFGRQTNSMGGYRASVNVTIEWESVAGNIYAVEYSPIAADASPTFDSTGRTNGGIGQGWLPISMPVPASGTVTRWTGGVWGDATEQRFYRIREL